MPSAQVSLRQITLTTCFFLSSLVAKAAAKLRVNIQASLLKMARTVIVTMHPVGLCQGYAHPAQAFSMFMLIAHVLVSVL